MRWNCRRLFLVSGFPPQADPPVRVTGAGLFRGSPDPPIHVSGRRASFLFQVPGAQADPPVKSLVRRVGVPGFPPKADPPMKLTVGGRVPGYMSFGITLAG